MPTQTIYIHNSKFCNPLADLSIIDRNCAALRLLRLLQAWGREHLVESGRGAVFVVRDFIRDKIKCGVSAYYRAIERLRSGGWIEDTTTVDEWGHERQGFLVAIDALHGFLGPAREPDANELRMNCETNANETRISTFMLKENIKGKDQVLTCEPAKAAQIDEPPGPEKPESDLSPPLIRVHDFEQLEQAAREILEHEEKVWTAHERRHQWEMRDWQAAHRRLADSLLIFVSNDGGLADDIIQFKAIVELTADRAVANQQTWEWWQPGRLWTEKNILLNLTWLKEPSNARYLALARGETPAPEGEPDEGPDPMDGRCQHERYIETAYMCHQLTSQATLEQEWHAAEPEKYAAWKATVRGQQISAWHPSETDPEPSAFVRVDADGHEVTTDSDGNVIRLWDDNRKERGRGVHGLVEDSVTPRPDYWEPVSDGPVAVESEDWECKTDVECKTFERVDADGNSEFLVIPNDGGRTGAEIAADADGMNEAVERMRAENFRYVPKSDEQLREERKIAAEIDESGKATQWWFDDMGGDCPTCGKSWDACACRREKP